MQAASIIELLTTIDLFSKLDSVFLSSISHWFDQRDLAEGEPIISRHLNVSQVIGLCSGHAQLITTSRSGKRIHIRDITEGELYGDLAPEDSKKTHGDLIATKPCRVVSIPQACFMSLMTHNPAIALAQIQRLRRMALESEVRLTESLSMRANQRIRKVLLDLSTPVEREWNLIQVPSHQEIALRANTQREVVAREISNLQKQGMMKKSEIGYLINCHHCANTMPN